MGGGQKGVGPIHLPWPSVQPEKAPSRKPPPEEFAPPQGLQVPLPQTQLHSSRGDEGLISRTGGAGSPPPSQLPLIQLVGGGGYRALPSPCSLHHVAQERGQREPSVELWGIQYKKPLLCSALHRGSRVRFSFSGVGLGSYGHGLLLHLWLFFLRGCCDSEDTPL